MKKLRDHKGIVLPILLSVALVLSGNVVSVRVEPAYAEQSSGVSAQEASQQETSTGSTPPASQPELPAGNTGDKAATETKPVPPTPWTKEVTAVAADGSQIKLLLRGEEYSLNGGLTWALVPLDKIIIGKNGIRISVDGKGEADYYVKLPATVPPVDPGAGGNSGGTGQEPGVEQGGDKAATGNPDKGQGTGSASAGPNQEATAPSQLQGGESVSFVEEREQTEGFAALTADGVDSLTVEQANAAGWLYDDSNGGSITILKYGGAEYYPHIPSQIDGKTVTAIGDAAFSAPDENGVWQDRCAFEELIIPSGVKTIGKNAFRGVAIESGTVVFPSGLTSIGDYAFAVDYDPDSGQPLTWTGYFEDLRLPAGLKSIGSSAFYGTGYIGSLSFRGSEVTIGDHAFARTNYIGSIDFGGSAATIGNYAFANSQFYSPVNLPASVSIGEYAFAETFLETVSLEGSRQRVERYAFANARSLSQVSLPANVQTIGDYAFANTALEGSLTLPTSCRSLGIYAFANTKALTDLSLPGSLSDVSIGAFAGSGISHLTLGEGTKTIHPEAFADCVNLREVIIPSTVTSLKMRETLSGDNAPTYRGAFAGCTALEKITIPGTVTEMGPSTIEGVPKTMIAYVDANSTAAKLLSKEGHDCFVTASTNKGSIRVSYWVYPYAKALPADTVLSLTDIDEAILRSSLFEKMSQGNTQVDLAFHLAFISDGKPVEPQGALTVSFYPGEGTEHMRTSDLYGMLPVAPSVAPNFSDLYSIWVEDTADGKGLEFAWPLRYSASPNQGDIAWTGNFIYAHYGLPPVPPDDRRSTLEEGERLIKVTDPGEGGAAEFVRADGETPAYSSRDFAGTKTTKNNATGTNKTANGTSNIGDTKTPESGGLDGTNGLAAGTFTVRLAGLIVDINWISLALLGAITIGVVLFYFARAKRMRYEEELL